MVGWGRRRFGVVTGCIQERHRHYRSINENAAILVHSHRAGQSLPPLVFDLIFVAPRPHSDQMPPPFSNVQRREKRSPLITFDLYLLITAQPAGPGEAGCS
jgi:hypothetical protein